MESEQKNILDISFKKQPAKKSRLHPRNKNRESYDLTALKMAIPELEEHAKINKAGIESIDFANPIAVKKLNQALLKHHYGIDHWDFPEGNLCPPIPGRADHMHYLADLLSENNEDEIPRGDTITCFDIGVGASCIYPIIGVVEYNWKSIGSDIEAKSIESAQHIVDANPILKNKIECRLQEDPNHFFEGIINENDKIDISICNPPFHASTEDAKKGSRRKVKNLTGKNVKNPKLNFGGLKGEMVIEGGETQFIQQMIKESKQFAPNFYWFSTLVSKKSNLKDVHKALDKIEASQVKTIAMGTGNKKSRLVAWSFLSTEEQKEWRDTRWNIK